MRGPVTVKIQNSHVTYDFTLYHNISLLVGYGGIGKSTVLDLIREAITKKSAETHLKCNTDIILLDELVWRAVDGNLKPGKLYIMDEDFNRLRSQDVINEFYKSGSFFLIITRLNSFIRALIDVNAIYTIVPRTKDGVTLNEFKLLYEKDIGDVSSDYPIKTEDKKIWLYTIKETGIYM